MALGSQLWLTSLGGPINSRDPISLFWHLWDCIVDGVSSEMIFALMTPSNSNRKTPSWMGLIAKMPHCGFSPLRNTMGNIWTLSLLLSISTGRLTYRRESLGWYSDFGRLTKRVQQRRMENSLYHRATVVENLLELMKKLHGRFSFPTRWKGKKEPFLY